MPMSSDGSGPVSEDDMHYGMQCGRLASFSAVFCVFRHVSYIARQFCRGCHTVSVSGLYGCGIRILHVVISDLAVSGAGAVVRLWRYVVCVSTPVWAGIIRTAGRWRVK